MWPSLASQQGETEEFERAIRHKLERPSLCDPALIAVLTDTINRISKFNQRQIGWDFRIACCRNALLRHPYPPCARQALDHRAVDRK